jgi:hypothetical protein
VKSIYDVAAPIPGAAPAAESTNFLDAIRGLFREAAEAAGAKVL